MTQTAIHALKPSGIPVREQVSQAEWEQRVNLAACYRLIARYGMSDLIYNHITAKVPGEPGHFLINPFGLLYEEITASNLYKIDKDANIVLQPDTHYGVNRSGYIIHSAIHEARPDLVCDRIERLAAAAQKAISTPAILAKVREMGIEPVTDSGPKPTREFIAREVSTLASVIKAANIVAE